MTDAPATEAKAKPETKPDDDAAASPQQESQRALVRKWTQKIRDARKRMEKDVKRMRRNMDIAAGVQYEGQESLPGPEYVNNIIIHLINQRVASLYAHDPKAAAKPNKRLEYKLWDGNDESLIGALQSASADPNDVMARMLIADYTQGRAAKEVVKKIGDTLEIVHQWVLDTQQPPFKTQAKQLVRRTDTCGVGYVRINFARQYSGNINTTTVDSTIVDRAKKVEALKAKLEKDDVEKDDARWETLRQLSQGLQASVEQGDLDAVDERISMDFLPVSSVIPDTRTRNIKGWVGASWLAIEYKMLLEDVNAFFTTKVKVGGELVQYDERGEEQPVTANDQRDSGEKKPAIVALWEVFDKNTRQSFFIVDGWKDYVQDPGPVKPKLTAFWPIYPLIFNDVEIEPGCKATIFPPSTVDLVYHAQMEWNRSRNCLRAHRHANRPLYATPAGWMTKKDALSLDEFADNQIIQFQGAPAGADASKLIAPIAKVPIDPAVYDTAPLMQDIGMSVGQQENAAPPGGQDRSSATKAAIQEQTRLQTTNSNVDDLDDFLSNLAQAIGEIAILEFSRETILRIAGPGAVWPLTSQEKEDYNNRLYLDVVAASSGRPNKALEVSNFERLAPLMMQAATNPALHGFVREGAKRLDDRMDPGELLPPLNMIQGQPTPTIGAQQEQQNAAAPPNPPQELGTAAAPSVPLPGA